MTSEQLKVKRDEVKDNPFSLFDSIVNNPRKGKRYKYDNDKKTFTD